MKRTMLVLLAVAAASLSQPAGAQRLETVARGLVEPWALAFAPDGRLLVTERAGRLRAIGPDGRPGDPIAGLPRIDATGQCGLLDLVVGPDGWLYFSYAEPGEGGTNGTSVARARLDGQQLADLQVIFRQAPKLASRLHCGSRIVFDREGHLFIGLGDRYTGMQEAQNPANHIGKVVRITRDGKAPADNPFIARSGAAPEVWSLGHRNIQGAALHPATGALWAAEHGPQGGDEVNLVQGGRNYGWPLVTYGRNYGSGTRIGEEGPKAGFEQPLKHWVPTSIAPSGMAFLTSDRYPAWRGSLFVGALRGQALVRLTLDGDRVVGEERLFTNESLRVRDVRQGPDGWLYLVAGGNDGRVLRVRP
ncbi:MAG: PQQ-dependent sugar dehydrogenase [Burkholderiaceae bacterium]|nr:PQQ-dependent sugar dehydrogenase [Burkholderiaceae bacterium]